MALHTVGLVVSAGAGLLLTGCGGAESGLSSTSSTDVTTVAPSEEPADITESPEAKTTAATTTTTVVSTTTITTAYDPAIGMQLAWLLKAVGCGADRFNRWYVGDSVKNAPGVDASKVLYIKSDKLNGQAGVGRMNSPNGCFVAFKGTDGTVQSIIDGVALLTDFGRESCSGCEVHAGWKAVYDSISATIFQTLEKFECQAQPLWLTGHSLGSAVMQYFLYDALDQGYSVAHGLAMESPRPGNPRFQSYLQAKVKGLDVYRVTHHKDIVVHVPPTQLYYRHALEEIWYPDKEGTTYEQCGVEQSACANQYCENVWNLAQCTGDDHVWYAGINPCSCQASDGVLV